MSSRLADSNPYLRNAAARDRSVLRSVATSSAIEGIHAPFKQVLRERSAQATASKPAGLKR